MQCSVCCFQGAVVANYPWDGLTDPDNTYSASPDDATFRYLAKVYADAHADMHDSKEFAEGITNGAHWYPISGGMQVKLVCVGGGWRGWSFYTWHVNYGFMLQICVSIGVCQFHM